MAQNFLSDKDVGFGSTKVAEPAGKQQTYLKDSDVGFEPPTRSLADWGKDIATTALKGAIGVPEALVGLADIPTGGAVGKFLENEGGSLGFRPKQAKEFLNEQQSEATKAARQEFQQAEGIGGKAVAALSNPSVIATTVGESLPSMFAGGALAKGIGLAAPALAGRAGLTAAGEGLIGAGSLAESVRQQTPDGLLTPTQSALAAGAGVATAGLGALGARAGKALGVGDIDSMIANGATQGVAREGMGIASRVGRGALSEGVLEELPQSLSETAFENIALDKPVTEGMDEAAVLGTLSGGLMGGAAGALSRPAKPSQQMGIDPNAGPLSRAAASAVDSQPTAGGMGFNPDAGATTVFPDGSQPMNSEMPQQSEIIGTSTAVVDGKTSTKINRRDGSVEIDGVQVVPPSQPLAAEKKPAQSAPVAPVSESIPLEQRSLDELRQAFRSAQDPAIRKTLAAEIRKRREAMPDPLAPVQPQQEISLEPQAPQAVQSQPQEAQSPAEPAVLGQPLTDTGTNMLGRGADPLQSIVGDGNEARRARDAENNALADEVVNVMREFNPGAEMPSKDEVLRQIAAQGQDKARSTINMLKKAVADRKASVEKIDGLYAKSKKGQADARRAADELRGTTGASTVTGGDITPPSVESPLADVRSGGRNDDAGTAQPDSNGDAGGAVGGTTESPAALKERKYNLVAINEKTGKRDVLTSSPATHKEAVTMKNRFTARPEVRVQLEEVSAVDRPDNWRGNAIKAGKVARSLGLDPKGKRLKEIVAEIDAVDAGSGVAAKPVSREQAIRDAWRKEPRTIGKWTPISVEAEGQKADMLVNQKRAGGDKDGALHVVNIRMGKMLKDMESEPIAYTFRLTADNRLVEEGIPTVATPGQIAAWKGAGFALDDKQANVQNTPQGTAGEAKAPSVKESKAEGGNAASNAGVPAAPGAGDVQADGVNLSKNPRELNTSAEPVQKTAESEQVAQSDGVKATAAQAEKPAEEAPAPKKTAEKIEDFGEKLAGARKDYAATLKDAMSVDVAAEPLSKSWPEPDYQKLLDGGADPFMVAWVHAARDEIPTKPQTSWKLSGWVKSVTLLRKVSADMLSGDITKERLQEMLEKPEYGNLRRQLGGRAELYQAVGHGKSLKGITFMEHHYSMYRNEKNVTKWSVEMKAKSSSFGGWPREIAVADTKADALAQFKEKYEGLQTGAKSKGAASFVIYRKRGEAGAFIGKKIGREYIDLHKAEDVKAARTYLADNTDKLEKALERYKETPYERGEENAPRVGGDHRNGAPVTPEVFGQTFGFRGVQFGNYVEQGRRQSDLNEAFDALMDMAAVLGIPPKAISLNGRLGLAFGARGKGGKNAPAAHYETGNMVINLTKGGGPGSLAHEWFHAMDNYFAKQGGDAGYMTDGATGAALREEMRQAFKSVKTAINAGALKLRSLELDKRRTKPYWSTPVEMAARSFESYVIAKLQDQSASNDYLANVVDQKVWDISEAARAEFFTGQKSEPTYPYPTVDELPALRAAFDDFFKVVQTRETEDGNTEMYYGTNDAKRQGTPVDRAIMDMAEEGREANEILSFIAKSSKSPYRRHLAQKLLATGANPAVSLGGEMGGGAGFRFLAKYSRKNHEVTLSEAASDRAEQIFLHETTHAATLLALDKGGLIATQMKRLAANVYKDASPEMRKMYGLVLDKRTGEVNVGEFVAEAFTNPQFQKSLKGMKADNGSLWDRLVNIVRRILGMEPRQQDALSRALELGAGVMRENMPLRAAKSFRAEDGPAFAGADQTETPAFRRWFGGSKVVDAQGKPLVSRSSLVAARKAAMLEGRMNGGASNAKSIADLLVSQAFSLEGLGGLEIPAQREVLNGVLSLGDDLKVLGSVVDLVPVDVVNILAGKNLAPEVLFRDEAVLKQLLSADRDGSVSTAIDVADALVLAVTRMAAKGPSIAPNPFFRSEKGRAAADTGETGVLHGGIVNQTIGNNGNFDPDDADIAHFGIADAVEQIGKQDAVKPVVQALNDTFKVRGKIHWWHKTVGTPFNLAERVPEFKRVFNSVQDFINSVSFYGAEAAAMAPKIIPKLESWKDLGKSPIKAEDNKAIAAPIFEGTLAWMRDESGRPVKVADMQAAADKLSADEKAQRLLRYRKISPEVLAMWRGLPLEQFQSNIETRYTSEMLRPGVVWKDSELRSLFKLTDEQIGLYREFRAATDKSLTDLAMSDILQFAGKDADPIKDQVMGMNLAEGSETVRDYLLSLADSDPDRRSDLIDTANAVIDKANRVQDLMDSGYAPLQRFGRFTVYAKDENGEQLFFGMYEDRRAAARAARQMREQYPGAKVETGMMSEEAYKMFQGISPETLEIFGTMLGMDSQADGETNKAFQTYLKLAKSNRSALKRLIDRKGISGYSEDASRVLASFIYSNARQTASNLHVGEIMNGVNDIPRDMGEAKDAAVRLARYTMDPQEEAQALRGLLFAQYLGGSIASAAINALQPAQVTFPYLSQFVGAKKSASLMTGAVRDALKKSTGDPRLDAELKKAEEEGIVSPQEIFQLMAQAQGKATLKAGDGTKAGDAMAAASNTLSRLSLGWGKVFSIPEQFNRRTTFIAAYRTAKETGEANPYEFAKQAVKETQLVYNKGNRPEWARGTIGALAFTFKTYSISYVELLQRMAASGPEGRRAALLMVGVLFIMAGAGGLPGVEDAEDVVDGIAQRVFGLNFQTRQKRQEWLADTFGEGGARFIENGLSGLPWSPTDVSGRLGLGNLIPGTGVFVKKDDYGRDVAEIAGPAADMTKRFLEGAGLLLQGEVLKAGEIVSPTAVRNMIQGGRMLATDQYTDTKGRKVIDTTPAEGITKLIGFQPADVARAQEATGIEQRMIALNKIRESEIADKWAKGLASGDPDQVQEARDELRKWNESNPESPIRINMPQLFRRVRALKEDKATRIARTAPKEIRQNVRRALEQGQ